MLLSKGKIKKLILVSVILGSLSTIMMEKREGVMAREVREERSVQLIVDRVVDNTTDENSFEQEGGKEDDVIPYVGVLEIPKINLKRGFMELGSSYNKVDLNVMVLNGSDMPDVSGGNLILAAHSGNSDVSYFKRLDKLKNGDVINVYYGDVMYEYRVGDIYEEEKNGVIHIRRDDERSMVTLTTCSNTDDNKQLVVIGYLI